MSSSTAEHAIAHNKIMIIDGAVVITGSFNFTKAAEEKNVAVTQAEPRPGFQNLLVLHDAALADKLFIPGPTERCACAECRFMKMNTLEKAHAALLNLEPEIILPEPLRARAELPIRRMLELSR